MTSSVWFKSKRARSVALISTILSYFIAYPVLAGGIPLARQGNTFLVPVTINRTITLNFVIDSGADDVVLSRDVVLTLIRSGTISSQDILGTQREVLADGSKVTSVAYRLRELAVGDSVARNVTALAVPSTAQSQLLGQSFLSRFPGWAIDNQQQILFLGDATAKPESSRPRSDAGLDTKVALTAARAFDSAYRRYGMLGVNGELAQCYERAKKSKSKKF